MLIIPDTYKRFGYLGNHDPAADRLRYVSLPAGSDFTVSAYESDLTSMIIAQQSGSTGGSLLFDNNDGLIFLVVEGSAAHGYCAEKGLQYQLRNEYCLYMGADGEFDAEAFYQDAVNGVAPSTAAPGAARPETTVAPTDIPMDPPAVTTWPETKRVTSFDVGYGTVMIPTISEEELRACEQYYPFVSQGDWGMADLSANILVALAYDDIQFCGYGMYRTERDGKKGLICRTDEVIAPMFDILEPLAPGILLLQTKDASGTVDRQFVLHLTEGCAYDFSGRPAALLEDWQYSFGMSEIEIAYYLGSDRVVREHNKHLLFYDTSRGSSWDKVDKGLYDYHGELLHDSKEVNFYIFFPDGRIGVTYQHEDAKMTSTELLNADGSVDVEEMANTSWLMDQSVPVRAFGYEDTASSWEIYFTQYAMKVGGSDSLYAAMEGWWTREGEYVTCEEADRRGFTFSNDEAQHVAVVYVSSGGNTIRIRSAQSSGAYPHGNSSISTGSASNGYVQLRSQNNVPYYVDCEITGFAAAEMSSYNNMLAFLNGLTGDRPWDWGNVTRMTLTPVSRNGIGVGEATNKEGKRFFTWTRMNHWENGKTVHVLDESRLSGTLSDISSFQYDTALVYSEDGKIGLINEDGIVLLPMEYDRIDRYDGYAVAMKDDVQDHGYDMLMDQIHGLHMLSGIHVISGDTMTYGHDVSDHSWLLNFETRQITLLAPQESSIHLVAAEPTNLFTSVQNAQTTAAPTESGKTYIDFNNRQTPNIGSYPVYSGPGIQYYRANNGKATVATNDWILINGQENGWLMIYYELSKGGSRVGYVSIADMGGWDGSADNLVFQYLPALTTCKSVMWDDPNQKSAAVCELEESCPVIYLCDYWHNDTHYAYIEIDSSGALMRGFVGYSEIVLQ